jgi:hypothetical protein
MKQITIVLIAVAALFAGGATQTFTGTITDSMCLPNAR